MHPSPTAEVIRSGELDHQRAVGGSIVVDNPEKGENQCENGENKHMKMAKIFEVSLDPA